MELTVTLVIVIVTTLVSVGGFSNQKMIDDLIFYPPAIRHKQHYRFITHGFIHADLFHLAFNMIALYSFGIFLEKVYSVSCIFGERANLYFLLLYFSSLIVASLPDYLRYRDSYHYKSLGASGAVSAVIFSSIVFFPQAPIGIFFIPIEIPGFIFAILYLAISAYLDKRGGGRINHSAHFWGAAFGIVFTIVFTKLFAEGFDVYDNFFRQIKSMKNLLPIECNFED